MPIYIRSNESVFAGRSDDDEIAIEIGHSRLTVTVHARQGAKVFEIDADYDASLELLELGREGIVGNLKDFEEMDAFYDCFDVAHWHDDTIESFASEYWTVCHDSVEDLYWQLYEAREESFQVIDHSIQSAVNDVLTKIAETRKCAQIVE